MSEEIESHLYKKFEIVQKLGKGAYGIVWKVIEKNSKKTVALKKVFEAFHNSTDAQRTFREIMILQRLNNHENIIKLRNVIKAENHKDIYLVFEFMETDLHKVIKAGILKKVHKQYITYQLLKGIKYIQSGDIIHRDLKPANLLINSECLLKIADFGLARSVNQCEEKDTIMTEYVATRWYRAPEIVLGSNNYSKAVDIWSVGCILGELINGKALFPGKSTLNQIELILEVLGKPSYEDIISIESENALSIINSIDIKNRKNFASFFKDQNPVTIDFLSKCLEFNPKKRITVEECLKHPFVAQFHDEAEEIVMDAPVLIPIDDNHKLTLEKYREALYNDIHKKRQKQKNLWRQKYLKQLGINLNDPKDAKKIFKNIIDKKKEWNSNSKLIKNKLRKKSSTKNGVIKTNKSKNKNQNKKNSSIKNTEKKYTSIKTEKETSKGKILKKTTSNKYVSKDTDKTSSGYFKKVYGTNYGLSKYNSNNYQNISNYYKNILTKKKK